MNRGKTTCKILKEIRKQIAAANDIHLVTAECHHQGDCRGTCPACEAEVCYLENELRKRKQMGKSAIVTGVSLGLATSFLGCHLGGSSDVTVPTEPEPAKQEETHALGHDANVEDGGQKDISSPPDRDFDRYHVVDTKYTVPTDLKFLDEYFSKGSDQADSSRSAADTIYINYDPPIFEPDGTVSAIRTTNEFVNVCQDPVTEAFFPRGVDSCKKYIQQHIPLSPKLRKSCQGWRVNFSIIVEKSGRIGPVFTYCPTAEGSKQKFQGKRCEHAVRKVLKTMPRWIPGKDENGKSVRCQRMGNIIIGDTLQIEFYP